MATNALLVHSVFDSLYEQLLGGQAQQLSSCLPHLGQSFQLHQQHAGISQHAPEQTAGQTVEHPPITPQPRDNLPLEALNYSSPSAPQVEEQQQPGRKVKRQRGGNRQSIPASTSLGRRNLDQRFEEADGGMFKDFQSAAWFYEQPSEEEDAPLDDGDWRQKKKKKPVRGKGRANQNPRTKTKLKQVRPLKPVSNGCTGNKGSESRSDVEDATKAGKVCAVCMESVMDDDNVCSRDGAPEGGQRRRRIASCTLPCGHTFHKRYG